MFARTIMKPMNETRASISEIFFSPNGTGMRLECESPLHPLPGQYLLARSAGMQPILPVPLFCRSVEGSELTISPPLPADWQPGTEIYLHGPMGNGFHPPATMRHLVLADLSGNQGQRLLQLASDVLETTFETALLSDSAPDDLPVEIEFLPLKALSEVLAWADYLAVEVPLGQLGLLRDLAGLQSIREFPMQSEALVDTPLICGGIGACGVCSVKVSGRWLLACKDGPVFRLNQLSEEE